MINSDDKLYLMETFVAIETCESAKVNCHAFLNRSIDSMLTTNKEKWDSVFNKAELIEGKYDHLCGKIDKILWLIITLLTTVSGSIVYLSFQGILEGMK